MRMTIAVEDEVTKALLRYSREKTAAAAARFALADWVRQKKIQELRSLRGKLEIADDLSELRGMEMNAK
jgi:hypothetical protein